MYTMCQHVAICFSWLDQGCPFRPGKKRWKFGWGRNRLNGQIGDSVSQKPIQTFFEHGLGVPRYGPLILRDKKWVSFADLLVSDQAKQRYGKPDTKLFMVAWRKANAVSP